MFRYYILLVSIFLIKVPAFAQNNQEFNKVKDLSFQFEELNRSLKNNNQDSVIFISKNIKSILNLGSEEEHARIIPLNEILIDSYRFKNQFDSASIIASENIELLKSNNDTLSINYTSNLVNLGSFQLELNKYKEAKATYNRAENLFKYRNDTTSTYYIEFLAGKGLTENYYSNFSEAKYYLLKADLLIEKYIKRDEKSPNLFYVANLTNLAIANDGIADFEEGLKIKLKEKKYLESFNITNTYGYYLNQYNISVSYIKLGRNFDSEKILLEGLKSINDLNLGSYLKSKFSEGLSLVYFNLGDSTKSEYYNKLAFSSDGYNKSNVNDYSIYIQKASQLQSKGDFLGAYKIFKFIIDEILKLGLPRGKEYLMAIRIAYELSGLLENPPLSFKQRVDLLLELNVLTPKLFGYVSNENADVNASFGSAYYYDLMDYSKSVKSYKLAIDILEAIPEQSRNRLALINYNRNISNSYEKLGDYQLAYSSLIKANLLRYKIINEQIPFISEIERDRFVLDNQEENSRIKSFIWRNYQNLNPNTYIADLLIIDEFFGGLSFNYSIKIRKLLESFSDDIKSKYVDLLDNDLTEFSTNFNNPIEAPSVENNDKRDLIKLITKQISEFKIQNTYLKIIDKKNFEGALVLFQSFKYDLLANTNLYSCVILSKDRTIIKYLPLFQESSLDSNLTNSNKTGSDLIKSINDIYSQKNKSQFRKYISEIIKLTKEFQNLVIFH